MDLEVNCFWGDAATKNCVWLFQEKREEYGENGCTCGAYDHEECEETGQECTCSFKYWATTKVFLTREEGNRYGESRPYAWGKKGEGWRIYGVPCDGLMARIIGQHLKEFEEEVENTYPKRVEQNE
jgi:hypothetical protein